MHQCQVKKKTILTQQMNVLSESRSNTLYIFLKLNKINAKHLIPVLIKLVHERVRELREIKPLHMHRIMQTKPTKLLLENNYSNEQLSHTASAETGLEMPHFFFTKVVQVLLCTPYSSYVIYKV